MTGPRCTSAAGSNAEEGGMMKLNAGDVQWPAHSGIYDFMVFTTH